LGEWRIVNVPQGAWPEINWEKSKEQNTSDQNMKTSVQFLAAVAVALTTVTQSVPAGPITGNIGFGGNVTFNTSSPATATAATSWINTQVLADSGSFASFVTPIAPASFYGGTWSLNNSALIANFWTVGGFSFELLSSSIISQGGTPGTTGFLVVAGSGIVSGDGFTPTVCNWSFSTQDPQSSNNPRSWTFSALITIPVTTNAPVLGCKEIISNHAVVLSWTNSTFTLQAAPVITGPYTNIPSATSPYTNVLTGTQRFFRLSQ
jgi:hypothetical protein